jgi:hypothetical protein
MMTYIVGYSGIALVAAVIVLLDYFGQRQQRKARKTAGGCSTSPHVDDFWP